MSMIPAEELKALDGILLLYWDMIRGRDYTKSGEATGMLAVWLRDNGMPVNELESQDLIGMRLGRLFVEVSLITGRVSARLEWYIRTSVVGQYCALSLSVSHSKDGPKIDVRAASTVNFEE